MLQALVRHLHGFAREVRLTLPEWEAGIGFLTRTGQMCDDRRQEFILLSDTLGLSMLADAIAHPTPEGATESTVLGPFYVADAPPRPDGADIADGQAGAPFRFEGQVTTPEGRPIPGAWVDVWQSDDDGYYDVPEAGRRGLAARPLPRRRRGSVPALDHPAHRLPDPRRRPGGRHAQGHRAAPVAARASPLHDRRRRAPHPRHPPLRRGRPLARQRRGLRGQGHPGDRAPAARAAARPPPTGSARRRVVVAPPPLRPRTRMRARRPRGDPRALARAGGGSWRGRGRRRLHGRLGGARRRALALPRRRARVTGSDHLLFLAGVVFFPHRLRDVAVYATLFTLGHSVTLLGGVLGGLRLSAYLVDAVIGLSVAWKALDNLGAFRGWHGYDPRAAVLGFGLVHGFGLSTKLQDLGLRRRRSAGRC